jgi:hypothetical protein
VEPLPETPGKAPGWVASVPLLPKSPEFNHLQVLWTTHLSNPGGCKLRAAWSEESAQKSFSNSTNKPLKN